MKKDKWEERIERARLLAASYAFAAEGLRFYERLARFQKSLYAQIKTDCGTSKEKRVSGTLRNEFDVFILLPRFAAFVAAVEEIAPPPLASGAHQLRSQNASSWEQALRAFWERPDALTLQPAERLLSRLFLQPYAEYLADHSEWSAPHGAPSTCPLCGSRPQVGVLRPEGDGGKRSLACSLCAMEWDYGRLGCVACGEGNPEKLPIYSASDFGYMRVEACEACHKYMKTVDLTKDGHAVPLVDELAFIPLDLWASEHGYEKIHPNLLGI